MLIVMVLLIGGCLSSALPSFLFDAIVQHNQLAKSELKARLNTIESQYSEYQNTLQSHLAIGNNWFLINDKSQLPTSKIVNSIGLIDPDSTDVILAYLKLFTIARCLGLYDISAPTLQTMLNMIWVFMRTIDLRDDINVVDKVILLRFRALEFAFVYALYLSRKGMYVESIGELIRDSNALIDLSDKKVGELYEKVADVRNTRNVRDCSVTFRVSSGRESLPAPVSSSTWPLSLLEILHKTNAPKNIIIKENQRIIMNRMEPIYDGCRDITFKRSNNPLRIYMLSQNKDHLMLPIPPEIPYSSPIDWQQQSALVNLLSARLQHYIVNIGMALFFTSISESQSITHRKMMPLAHLDYFKSLEHHIQLCRPIGVRIGNVSSRIFVGQVWRQFWNNYEAFRLKIFNNLYFAIPINNSSIHGTPIVLYNLLL